LVGEVIGGEAGVSDDVEGWVSVAGDEDESTDPLSLPHPTIHKEAPRKKTFVLHRVARIISMFSLLNWPAPHFNDKPMEDDEAKVASLRPPTWVNCWDGLKRRTPCGD
jgi:hypothetical protein